MTYPNPERPVTAPGSFGPPPTIAQQLGELHPICTARRMSRGWKECGNPARWIAEVHATHQCTQPGLTADGDIIETLCDECLNATRGTLITYIQRNSYLAAMYAAIPSCHTCGRPQVTLESLLTVKPIGEGS
ncbi:hypothetical protein [Mycobacterium malmoense]|uniref:hypothetical protein n=1 Tax=Mycobacterium malmoense TaxID=1780 RepID=UPI0008F8CFA8|nr:hypothetical protein [Mycobacterium malmoense]OIN80188.1 hypothetical protein BMG05_13140 [Mycobacterium malmoense]